MVPPSPEYPVDIVGDVANGFRWLVLLIAVGIAFSFLGLDIAWLALAALVIIVVGGLVLRPQMENLAAGLGLTARPAFTIGDVIEVARNVGAVVQIGSHSTAIETIEGKRVQLPNAEMLSRTITVHSARDSRRAEFDLKVRSHTDLDRPRPSSPGLWPTPQILVSDPAPDVVASRISDNAVTLTVRVWFPSTGPPGHRRRDPSRLPRPGGRQHRTRHHRHLDHPGGGDRSHPRSGTKHRSRPTPCSGRDAGNEPQLTGKAA